jgi:hypothetical protein
MARRAQSDQEITKAAEDHKNSLLPRLYTLSMLIADKRFVDADEFYVRYLKQLDDDVFGTQPSWPPGAPPHSIHELFCKDDLGFIFKNLLGRK